jgi:anti-sigma factor RsiW
LQDYVEGRLAKQKLARIEAYLRDNPDCAEKVEKLRRQVSRMRILGKALMSEEVPQRLLDVISQKSK